MKSIDGLKKTLFILIGLFALLLGLVGLFVRLLPTTPFLLLSSWCFARSSRRLHQRLLHSQIYQKTVKEYMERKGFPLKTKILILCWVWILLLLLFFTSTDPLIKGIALALGTAKTLFFLFLIKTIE